MNYTVENIFYFVVFYWISGFMFVIPINDFCIRIQHSYIMYQYVYEACFIQHLHVQNTSNTYYNKLKKHLHLTSLNLSQKVKIWNLCIFWKLNVSTLPNNSYGSISVMFKFQCFCTLVLKVARLRAVPLPQADAVGFGFRWSARLSVLLQGRCWFFNLGSSSLAWLWGEPSTVFLLLCLPSGCGHPLGSLVSFVTIDRQRRFPLEEFSFAW